jgi:hypothetical protein
MFCINKERCQSMKRKRHIISLILVCSLVVLSTACTKEGPNLKSSAILISSSPIPTIFSLPATSNSMLKTTVLPVNIRNVDLSPTLSKLNGIHGNTWLNENQLIVSKQNLHGMQQETEHGAEFPINLYIKDWSTEEFVPVKENATHYQINPVISPNQQHLFYYEVDNEFQENAKGWIIDLKSK